MHSVSRTLIALTLAALFMLPGCGSDNATPRGNGLRIAATIFPLAFPMGMFFPIGIKLLGREHEELIPWAWATNGCFSVLGIFGTRIAALFVGFSDALLAGLLAYLMVAACVWVFARKSQSRISSVGERVRISDR